MKIGCVILPESKNRGPQIILELIIRELLEKEAVFYVSFSPSFHPSLLPSLSSSEFPEKGSNCPSFGHMPTPSFTLLKPGVRRSPQRPDFRYYMKLDRLSKRDQPQNINNTKYSNSAGKVW